MRSVSQYGLVVLTILLGACGSTNAPQVVSQSPQEQPVKNNDHINIELKSRMGAQADSNVVNFTASEIAQIRTASLVSLTYGGQEVAIYENIDGLATQFGDVVIGRSEDMPALLGKYTNHLAKRSKLEAQGHGLNASFCMLADVGCWVQDEVDYQKRVLWRGEIAYSYGSSVTSTQRDKINDAVYKWNQSVAYPKWRLNATAVNRVEFTTKTMPAGIAAQAQLGRLGGIQYIWIDPATYNIYDPARKRYAYGTIMHEMGHTVGLLHEHQRCDREVYAMVNDPGQTILCGDKYKAYGPYNYSSIMHYGPWQSVQHRVGTPINPPVGSSAELGQRERIDTNDLRAIAELYTF